MKAIRLIQPGRPLEAHDIPVPQPGAHDVLIRVKAAGICHSDSHYRAGKSRVHPLPLTLGHEVTEIVEGLTAADLPDRWQGLACFDAIAWIGADIGELRGETARALREWVRRGGAATSDEPSNTG